MNNAKTPACADIAAIDLDGICAWPSIDDTHTWSYLAGPLRPELAPNGKPTLALLEFGDRGILQFGAQWSAAPDSLHKITIMAAQRAGVDQVRLSPASADIRSARLWLTDSHDKTVMLQETSSSNVPPYTALFHQTLEGDALARAKQALSGKPGILTVSYAIRVQHRTRAIARLSGQLDPTVLAAGGSNETLLRDAMAAGLLTLTETVEGAAPESLRASTRSGAIDRAASMLGAARAGDRTASGSLSIDATVSLADIVTDEINRDTDIATWFHEHAAANVLQAAVAAPAGAPQQPVAGGIQVAGLLSVDRSLQGAPVAFIEAKTATATTLLRGPDFAAANLATGLDADVSIQVHYTDGGPPFRSRVAWAGGTGCVLGADDLGMAFLSLDASARKSAGAESLWAKVTYAPSGEGTADQHEVRFRYGSWTDTWVVVTRDRGLGGKLALEWRETRADGTTDTHPLQPADATTIIL